MLVRTIYSIYNAIIYRNELSRVVLRESLESITDINKLVLSRKQIRILALDFDGVLAPNSYDEPVLAAKQWLDSIIGKGYLKCIYIYSNKPIESRKQYFETHYPEIKFISKVRKKPYPDGLYEIARLEAVPTEKIAMVDDRLMTGILAAIIAGSSSIFIKKPFIDYTNSTVKEIFFTALRFIERQIFWSR